MMIRGPDLDEFVGSCSVFSDSTRWIGIQSNKETPTAGCAVLCCAVQCCDVNDAMRVSSPNQSNPIRYRPIRPRETVCRSAGSASRLATTVSGRQVVREWKWQVAHRGPTVSAHLHGRQLVLLCCAVTYPNLGNSGGVDVRRCMHFGEEVGIQGRKSHRHRDRGVTQLPNLDV